jgi:hypothetical protein
MNEEMREIRANYVARASTRLIVCTPTARFEGTFHYPIAARLSDAIRMAFTSEHHFLLTDVSISDNDSLAESASRAPFICINGAHVDVVIPMEEAAQASDSQEPSRSIAA